MNKGSEIGYKAFTTIGYAIPRAASREDVMTLFNVLSGRENLSAAINILPQASILQEYHAHEKHENWKGSANWTDWWTRSSHLSK